MKYLGNVDFVDFNIEILLDDIFELIKYFADRISGVLDHAHPITDHVISVYYGKGANRIHVFQPVFVKNFQDCPSGWVGLNVGGLG